MMFFCDTQKYAICTVLSGDKNYNITHIDSGHMFIGKGEEVAKIIIDAVLK